MWRLPLCTPNVNPTMSGVIVDRRDQVRITCGRCEPARMRSTVFRIPLSTQGPFLTERGITINFGLRIADCGLRIADCGFQFRNPKSEFRNLFHSPISHDHLLRTLVSARLVSAGWL